MYWRKRDSRDVVAVQAIHDGTGSINTRLFFKRASWLPVSVAALELDPEVSEGSHIHAADGALEELSCFLEGVGTMWLDGEDLAFAAG